jgi:ubiquitin carboxyl-terminal hydrolase 4/11/15
MLASAVATDKTSPARIWSVQDSNFNGALYPSSRLRLDGPKIVTPSNETLEDAQIEPEDAFVVEFMENGSFIIDHEKLPQKLTQPDVPPPLFSSDTDFFNQKFGSSSASTSTGSKFASTSTLNGKIPGLFKSSTFGSLINTRNHTVQEPGTLGLGNMYAYSGS